VEKTNKTSRDGGKSQAALLHKITNSLSKGTVAIGFVWFVLSPLWSWFKR
jgi:hypothetical protein